MDLNGKKVAIIGFGVEGISTLKYLSRYNVEVYLLDRKERNDLDSSTKKLIKGLGPQLVFGKNYLDGLEKFDLVFRSPSVRPDLPQLVQARSLGVLITSQTKLFFDLCKAPIIGVTGTKGKGTTASLLYEILKIGKRKVFLAGNIGNPPLDVVDQINNDSLVVLELSSFQLMDLEKSPHVAVILMVVREHLDWHKDMKEYLAAKKKIVENQNENDIAIINNDYSFSKKIGEAAKSKKYYFSTKSHLINGAYAKNGKMVLNVGGMFEEINASMSKLRGEHNLQNICAASLAAKLLGVSKEEIEEGISSFKGLPHRLEFVREINGVSYYNDSASTIPETTIAAIGAFKEPKILILGGSSKKSDFTDLGKAVARSNVSAVILIGEEAKRIKDHIKRAGGFSGQFIQGLKNMSEIVNEANRVAKKGDVVVLSPGCASFGLFKDYQDRGNQFARAVNTL